MFAVEMQNITKSFGGFKANDSVNFKAAKGEIHALVGENGAGKSTLMKILYGMYHPDSGTILINGSKKTIDSPLSAISLGIGMVHQHFMLVDTLTVLENIILGDETTKHSLLDTKTSAEKINSLTKNFNIRIDLNAKVGSLAVGVQQKIEILKLLYRNADILILDEPTAVLTPQETDELFATLKKLKQNGKTIILITHKLREVLVVSDSVTVLRRGRSVSETETSKTSREELSKLIVGEEYIPIETKQNGYKENVILAVQDLTVKGHNMIDAVKDISFNIHEGEIFGIAGVEGNGQSELTDAINGLLPSENGTITISGKQISKDYIIAHIPADRHKSGMVKEYSVTNNMILGRENEKKFSGSLTLKEKDILSFTQQQIKEYDIRPDDPYKHIGGLSGGNQQKVVAARELTKNTELIIASHPTRGLDIKASAFVHHALINESKKGKAILIVSSDLTELLKICDTIAVMYNGRFTAVLNAKETNEREIGKYMTGLAQDG